MSTIAWLLPGLLEGSGGHRTILQHADYLQRQGHRCLLYVETHESFLARSLQKDIRRLFGYQFDEVHAGWRDLRAADMVFATVWYSAKVVRDLTIPCVKCYFVQDYEAQFNPVGDGYLMAENSYRYGLCPITIGRWLPALLERQFGVEAAYFDFCADLSHYRRLPDVARERAICFIFQPDKPRRCAQLGVEALGIVKHCMPEVKIYLYGSKLAGRVWFEHQHLGLLSLAECNRLYNRCSVGLCISSTNPSRIPFEMMAAGLPVVEVYRDNNLYDFPEEPMLLCEPTPESLAAGLIELLKSPDRAQAMGRAGQQFMAERPIEHGLEQFGATVDSLLEGKRQPRRAATVMYSRPPLIAPPRVETRSVRAVQSGPTPDGGRLARLPPLPRKAVRFVYYRLRRLLS